MEQSTGLPVIYCSTHNRPKHPITTICLEPTCTTKSLLCEECTQNAHKDHKHILLSHFL